MRRTLLTLVALLGLLPAAVAEASFPGRNGDLAVVVEGCDEPSQTLIKAFSPKGRDLGTLVPCAPGGPDDEPGPDVHAPDWSPDGSRLLFAEGEGANQQFATVAADGSDRQDVPVGVAGSFGERDGASFAPDGRRLAFVRNHSIYTAALDGSDLRLLREMRECRAGGICITYGEPRWSPDGRLIAFTVSSAQPRIIRSGLWLMDADTGRLVRRLSRRGSDPDWSPDSRRLLFRTDFQQREIRGGASGGNIFVVRADGKRRPRRIVHRENLAEIEPTWAPNGRSIAWISLRFGAGDVSFDLRASIWRKRRGGRPRLVRKLGDLYVEEGFWDAPDLAWQPLPR